MNNKAIIVDIGNSVISIGIFLDGKLSSRFDMSSSLNNVNDFPKLFSSFLKEYHVFSEDVIGGLICSVVPMYSKQIQQDIKNLVGKELPIMDASYAHFLKVIVDNPKEVGSDLLADVAAAKCYYDMPCILFDLGTITKTIVVDLDGTLLGVNFFPGVEMCFDSMHVNTAQLPDGELTEKPSKIIGNNSIEALQGGVYYGTVALINGMSQQIEEKYQMKMTKVLTGGNSNIFKDSFPDYEIDPDLVLKGIYIIYTKN